MAKTVNKINHKTTHFKDFYSNYFPVSVNNFFIQVSLMGQFIFQFSKEAIKPRYEFNEITKQSFLIGYNSFALISITGLIMGLVLTIQSRPTLAEFGAESWLPAMVAVSIIREIGPVITALIFAGKVGSGIGAELASMKVTEQIDAMEVAGNNPFKYLIVTRVIACTFMLPLLVILSDAISLYGAYIGVNISSDVSFRSFFLHVFEKLSFTDVMPAFIKTFFFGFAIGIISSFKGYHANKGTASVGEAANSAVVLSSLSVFIIDIIAVQISDIFNH
jgi:phospholipid/cholesterol/gamma-HCH transport system permease protein